MRKQVIYKKTGDSHKCHPNQDSPESFSEEEVLAAIREAAQEDEIN